MVQMPTSQELTQSSRIWNTLRMQTVPHPEFSPKYPNNGHSRDTNNATLGKRLGCRDHEALPRPALSDSIA